ncbi:uncharacterized protein B0I36DRAFT_339167 [Microdochium trichocladiopsis]|uniref:Uncharacterized protein n=1 Tax=Microdochium trichocladiopsis TaxID=1682393 RepID=A0A9P8XQW0_9PEZI|nr:uncharacterized protein B0I36DRAFT_339167 [Microdochium trichocladiopsis]KAH7012436.1 hypothetical protein B0I36DRAFT_339167 [Microdochium trichocladiopsis]
MLLKQEHEKGSFELHYMATNDMPADGLTKNLTRQKFEDFRKHMSLENISHMLPQAK